MMYVLCGTNRCRCCDSSSSQFVSSPDLKNRIYQISKSSQQSGSNSGGGTATYSLDSTHVISAFHTISHLDLNNINKELDHDVLYFANESLAESNFLNLITTIKGLNPVNCGTLDLSFLIESQVPLLLNINKIYKKSTSIKIKGL